MRHDITTYRQLLNTVLTQLKVLPLHRLDSDPKYLEEAFGIAYDKGLFELHDYDNSLQNALKFELFSALCPLSGSLAFLAIQILAANRIMQANRFSNAGTYYKKRCGIAINHLRAPVTVVDATRNDTGYQLTGRLTWASGYKIFDTLVIGFHHDGQEMQAVMPFRPQKGCLIGEPEETFVGQSMNTVNIELDAYEIPYSNIISSHPIGSYTRQKSISKTIHFALYGIGVGAIDALQDEELKTTAANRLEIQRKAFMQTSNGEQMDKLRVELFNLVQQVITTGMILYGGKSILAYETLQRYYRELIMFNSNGLNETIKMLFKHEFLTPTKSISCLVEQLKALYGDDYIPYGTSEDEENGTGFRITNIPVTFSVISIGEMPQRYDVQIECYPPGDYLYSCESNLEGILRLIKRFAQPIDTWPAYGDAWDA